MKTFSSDEGRQFFHLLLQFTNQLVVCMGGGGGEGGEGGEGGRGGWRGREGRVEREGGGE